MDRSDPGAGARARRWARLAKYLALGPLAVALLAAALLTSTPLLAQSSGRLIIGPSIGARTFSPQGLPPATMRDYTGRSPGALRPGTTTPSAPYIIPPAYSGKPDIHSRRHKLPPPTQRVE